MRADQRGFTLLEVMVAFAIAAIALAVLFRSTVSGLDITATANRYEEAVARARSHLAVIGLGNTLRPGVTEGSDRGGYHWRVRVARVAVTTSPTIAGITLNDEGATLYRVTVTVSWDAGKRAVTLSSARLGRGRGGTA